MIYKADTETEYSVKTLVADMGVRYWEDGILNGEDDNDEYPKMPLIKNGRWVIVIDLASGVIADWPKGMTASVHYKVCDDGAYSLFDEEMNLVKKKEGYVPDILSPSGSGFGDYVIMDIDANGRISDWRADLSYFDRE